MSVYLSPVLQLLFWCLIQEECRSILPEYRVFVRAMKMFCKGLIK